MLNRRERLGQFQGERFGNFSKSPPQALAEVIRARDLATAIEILPPNNAGLRANTILKGHQRIRALRPLGKTEHEVIVRHNLAEADAATIELEFLEDNVHRRQLDKLAMARIALWRYELANPDDADRCRPEGEARDHVGRTIGMSGRNLDRYLGVLKLPMPLQRAFQEGLLPLAKAARLANLPESEIAEITRRVEAGEKPSEVARSVLPGRGQNVSRTKSVAARIEGVHAILEGLDSELCQGPARLRAGERRRLEEAGGRLASILERCAATRNRPACGPGE